MTDPRMSDKDELFNDVSSRNRADNLQARLARGERGIPKIPDSPDTRHAQAQPPRCPECLSDSRKYGNPRPCENEFHVAAARPAEQPAPPQQYVCDKCSHRQLPFERGICAICGTPFNNSDNPLNVCCFHGGAGVEECTYCFAAGYKAAEGKANVQNL